MRNGGGVFCGAGKLIVVVHAARLLNSLCNSLGWRVKFGAKSVTHFDEGSAYLYT